MPSMGKSQPSNKSADTLSKTRAKTASDAGKPQDKTPEPPPKRPRRGFNTPPSPPPKRKLFQEKSEKSLDNHSKAPPTSFPNLTNAKEVDQAWNVGALQKMLKAVGESTAGSKSELISRIIDHARVDDISKISSSHVSKLSDLQVAFILQKHDVTLDLDNKIRRTQLRELIGKLRIKARSSTPPDDVANFSRLEQRIADMEKMINKLCNNVAGRKSAENSDHMEMSDSDPETLSDDANAKPGANSELGKRKAPADAADDDKFSTFASTLATALTDSLASFADSASGNNNSVAVIAKLDRTHPSLVDPRRHNNDPHKYGLLIRRMITVDYRDAGIAALSWRRSCKQQITIIHGMIHSGTSQSMYNEGETLFIAYVNECITLAIEHDFQASKYTALRAKQLGLWNESFNDMKTSLREAGRYMKSSQITYRLQMEDIMTTALDVGMSTAQIKNLQTTFKLRSALGSSFAGADDDFGAPPDAAYPPRGAAASSGPLHRQNATNGALSNDPRKPKKPNPGKVTFGGSGDNHNAPSQRTITGERMPLATSIMGAATHGASPCDLICGECGKGGSSDTGHRKFECPKKFALEHPGRTMPGFDRDGERIIAAWDGADINPSTKSQWLRMISQGYFTQPPFRSEPDKRPDLRK
jgi:hypothetical protein